MITYRLYDVHGGVIASDRDMMRLIDRCCLAIKADALGMDIERNEVGAPSTSGVVKYDSMLPGMVIAWRKRE